MRDPAQGVRLSYITFLLQWYNWAYVAALGVGVVSFMRLPGVGRVGEWLGRRLGIERVSGRVLVRVFGLATGVLGLTVNGALHDYWPAELERGFLPGLILTLSVSAWVTRWLGRVFERHFPEIKAVGWGATDLAGREGRIVSRKVDPDYRAGRVQVMGDDGVLHMAMCKTHGEELPYGALVVLTQYDEADRRYYVERAEGKGERGEGVGLQPGG